MSSHDSLYTPPTGRGFSADDLAAEQLKQFDKTLETQLPALVEYGASVYLEEIRQQERMKALELKIRESLSPDNAKRAREIFRARAEAKLKAEAAVKVVEAQASAIAAAEARVQSEKQTVARSAGRR